MDFETIEQDRKTKNVNIFTAFIKVCNKVCIII